MRGMQATRQPSHRWGALPSAVFPEGLGVGACSGCSWRREEA